MASGKQLQLGYVGEETHIRWFCLKREAENRARGRMSQPAFINMVLDAYEESLAEKEFQK